MQLPVTGKNLPLARILTGRALLESCQHPAVLNAPAKCVLVGGVEGAQGVRKQPLGRPTVCPPEQPQPRQEGLRGHSRCVPGDHPPVCRLC